MLNLTKLLLNFISLILGLDEPESFPPPLDKETEREMFERMRDGDKEARAILIERNLRLISHIIRKYYSSYSSPEELLSVGSLGLIKAVDSFKSEKGTRFATYGAKCVQNEILMYFRTLKKQSGEVSLSDPIDTDKDGNALSLIDIISCDDTMLEDLADAERRATLLRVVVTSLEKRESDIIIMRYGLYGGKPHTQQEVAKHFNISRSYVSRIEKKALGKLKSVLDD